MQVLPEMIELQQQAGFKRDPVGDLEAEANPGLLHKYSGRALVIATGACAVHCRYCFRRHYPYAGGVGSPRRWRAILNYLEADRGISEVILSGGDPLMLSDAKLTDWFAHLSAIEHIKRLRIHTRLPVVLPERITPQLLRLLASTSLQTVGVVHINHFVLIVW